MQITRALSSAVILRLFLPLPKSLLLRSLIKTREIPCFSWFHHSHPPLKGMNYQEKLRQTRRVMKSKAKVMHKKDHQPLGQSVAQHSNEEDRIRCPWLPGERTVGIIKGSLTRGSRGAGFSLSEQSWTRSSTSYFLSIVQLQ